MKKYPSYGLLLALSVLAAVPLLAQSTASQEEQISLNLMAQTARTHLLTPSAKDSAGNVTQATAEVQVPRESGK